MDKRNPGLRYRRYLSVFVLAVAMPLLLLLVSGGPQSYAGMGGMGGGGGSTSCSTPNTFNAVDSGQNAVSGKITTKIAGASFTLDIYAINTGTSPDSICTGFSASSSYMTVELLGSQTPAAALGNYTCPSGFTTISSQSVSLSSGKGTVTLPAVANAWRNVYVRVQYQYTSSSSGGMGGMGGMGGGTTTTITGCSSDNFAIRPDHFNLSATDSDWQTAGTTRALANTGVSGGKVHKAGRPFTITATAVNAAGNTTSQYSGSPTETLSKCSATGGGCPANLGTLSTGTWSASGGTVTTTSASYSEVGSFSLQLSDSDFASVDAGDSTASQRTISGTADVGRFVPDHFDLTTANTPEFQTFGASGSGRTFTYIGQPFGYVTAPQATIAAKNAGGGVTQNYTGSLWKVTAADVTQTYSPIAPASLALDTALIGTPTVTAGSGGDGTVSADANDKLAFSRDPGTPQAAFKADISLDMSVVDNSEKGVSGNGTITTTTPAQFNGTGSGIAFDSGDAFRYGRLKLSNAYGSQLLALPVPLEAQYWNGTAFVTNTADGGTVIPAGDIALGNYQGQLQSGDTSVSISGSLTSGRGNLTLTQPAGGHGGSVDLTVDLSASGANLPWLQGNWNGGNYDQNPKARAVFGVYGGSRGGGNGLIYQREVY